ncbi:MAG TPA: helix-turn-helix domain-containing protein [Actinomycetes bacterium]|nr:helix-turn-helix domain-containing protein [Actinomycetes bacterium]
MIRSVAVPVLDNVFAFELGLICEVFGLDRPDEPELPTFDFAVCTPRPGPVRTMSGFGLDVAHGLERIATADLVAVPAIHRDTPVPDELVTALRAAHDRGARVMSVCSGAFVLGQAGLLDDRDCTTHWSYADELARRFPRARVNSDVLYVDCERVLTSAGTAAGIDAALYLVREEFGERVANRLARRMVMPPHREGGQRQYVDRPAPIEADTLTETLSWMTAHLDADLTVDELAQRAHLSARTFARRFRSETGTTPHHWLTGQRVLAAQRLLEETDQPVETVADLAGFGSAAVLRHHFTRRVGTTPTDYRRTFAHRGLERRPA